MEISTKYDGCCFTKTFVKDYHDREILFVTDKDDVMIVFDDKNNMICRRLSKDNFFIVMKTIKALYEV